MTRLNFTGISEVAIDARDSLDVIAEPLDTSGQRVRVSLSARKVLELDGLFIGPSGGHGITVYREADSNVLFLVTGGRSEERIQVLSEGPNEEKSEIVLERVCYLSAFAPL